MEGMYRWALVTAIAPIACGGNYFVTHQLLPSGSPLWGAAIRAIPAGLLLLGVSRTLPHGSWWWKSLVLGVLNVGAFFALVYLSAQLLPTGVVAAVMALSPLVMMLFAWALAGEQPRLMALIAGLAGIVGVIAIVVAPVETINPLGILCAAGAMSMSSLGFVLAKGWKSNNAVLASTSWQLLAGGGVMLIAALIFEGAPPALNVGADIGFGYVIVVATALAYVAWFSGFAHLSIATVGLIGLLNPVTPAYFLACCSEEKSSPSFKSQALSSS
jgi:probable blue pigment (indigoidine) exporter